MADGDRQFIGGWLVVEDWRLPWWAAQGDHDVKIMGCGEIGQARHELFKIAWKEVCRRDLQAALSAFAERVGVEYDSGSRRTTPKNADNAGGTP